MNKTTNNEQIFVRSNVKQDILQNAALFKTDKAAIWEYVSNGLDYINEGINPVVTVTLENRKKKIIIQDNGRGMNAEDLKNFFIMHGENIDRKKGRPGRGRFGTGKSAAFGIANILRISTVKNGKLSIVELKRNDIETMNSADPIPINIKKLEDSTELHDGTMVEIEESFLKSFDQAGIIRFIERQIAQWRNATVYVDNHECALLEPPIAETHRFRPDEQTAGKIGNVELIINVSSTPVDEELRGVSIYSNSVWHETTLAGNQNREMSQFIFGEIDVPKIDEDKSPISPYDLTRSMSLNPYNEIVQAIHAFVGQKIEVVRRELVAKEKQRKESEDSKKLASQAEKIAKVINDDFTDYSERIIRAKVKGGIGFDRKIEKVQKGIDDDNLSFGSQVPAQIDNPTGGVGSEGGNRSSGNEPRKLMPDVSKASSDAEKKGQPSGRSNGLSSSKGGFHVEFKPMGEVARRAIYVPETRTIYINIEHPQLVAAKGSDSVDNTIFKRLAYEVAFTEYAIALAVELNSNDEYTDPSDPIIDIRDAINRIAVKAASLYEV